MIAYAVDILTEKISTFLIGSPENAPKALCAQNYRIGAI
jgi:hypothetical protein